MRTAAAAAAAADVTDAIAVLLFSSSSFDCASVRLFVDGVTAIKQPTD